MATFLKGKGFFSLSDSDTCIGSFFSIADICEILDINEEYKFCFSLALEKMGIIRDGYVDEKDLYKRWKDLKKIFSKTSPPSEH